MMRSLYAGVSGLQNHQTRMDVIGNNIANVNTDGFKKGRVQFQDLISQTAGSPSRPNERVGGINPKQVGLGVKIATIDTIQTQGSVKTTGVKSDLALLGEGFFMLKNGEKLLHSRYGGFTLDKDGTLVTASNGFKVQGWTAQEVNGEPTVQPASDPGDLVIPVGGKEPPKETSEVRFASNLDKSAKDEDTWLIDKTIYDSFGAKHTLSLTYQKVPGVQNQWTGTVQIDGEDPVGTNATVDIGGNGNNTNTFTVNFDNSGSLQSLVDPQGDTINQDELLIQVSYDVLGTNPGAGGAPQQQTIDLRIGAVGDMSESSTQAADAFSNKAIEQNGYGLGYLQDYSINTEGEIRGVYTNGVNKLLGKIALSRFTNPGGLEKVGGTLFQQSINSGEARIGESGVAGYAVMQEGALEMSNVDLTTEFTDMIVTQRGFQANSKTIQTSDQLLQEILTLKR